MRHLNFPGVAVMFRIEGPQWFFTLFDTLAQNPPRRESGRMIAFIYLAGPRRGSFAS